MGVQVVRIGNMGRVRVMGRVYNLPGIRVEWCQYG